MSLTVKSRYQKLNEQVRQSTQDAIRSAHQAHTAVTQAQSSLLPQEIQYAERKVSEALTNVRHVQNYLEVSMTPELQQSLQQEEAQLLQEYKLF